MKIVFLSGGAREEALKGLLQAKKEVVGVIVPKLSKQNDRFKNVILTAIEHGVTVYPVDKDSVTSQLKALNFDILISCGFSYVLDKEAIESAPLAINVHPTLLPKYRGYRSAPYIIMNGEKETGVTVHMLEQEMDKGDIILQKKIDITPFDTTKSIFLKAQKTEVEVLKEAVGLIERKEYILTPQDESKATTYNYIRRPSDSEIDSAKPLNDLYNDIRACDPVDYPAFFYVDGERIGIKLWRLDTQSEEGMI